jgi:hypothetical protein
MPISAHGFLLRDGVFNKIDFPGVVGTTIVGLNARGDFVGSYVDSVFRTHGFVRTGEDFQTVDIPGAVASFALGVNARGVVVGGYYGNNGTDHGFAAKQKQ